MSAQHYFFSTAGQAHPTRWREAFPDGYALGEISLIQRLNAYPQKERVVWLSSADDQWRERLRQLLLGRPAEHVVLLSSQPDDNEELQALNDGVRGYAHEHAVPQLLQEVALVVLHGGLWVGPHLLRRLVGATHAALANRPAQAGNKATATDEGVWALLSARETQVAREVSAGRSNKEVAALLNITERTVKAHLGAVFDKLGVRDRLQLVLRLSGPELPSR